MRYELHPPHRKAIYARFDPRALQAAQTGGYAIGGFNVYNLEGVVAVVAAAEAQRSPALLQIHPAALTHGGAALVDACLGAARTARVPIAVHLDHCGAAETICASLDSGVQSIMADGSQLAYGQNVTFVAAMTALAQSYGASVEAELGRLSGTEDGLTIADYEAKLTDPAQAAAFVAQPALMPWRFALAMSTAIICTSQRLISRVLMRSVQRLIRRWCCMGLRGCLRHWCGKLSRAACASSTSTPKCAKPICTRWPHVSRSHRFPTWLTLCNRQ